MKVKKFKGGVGTFSPSKDSELFDDDESSVFRSRNVNTKLPAT